MTAVLVDPREISYSERQIFIKHVLCTVSSAGTADIHSKQVLRLEWRETSKQAVAKHLCAWEKLGPERQGHPAGHEVWMVINYPRTEEERDSRRKEPCTMAKS